MGYVLHFVDGAGQAQRGAARYRFHALDSRYPVHPREPPERDRAVLARVHERALRRIDRVEHRSASTSKQDADGVTATLDDGRQRTRDVRCRYLVACDGIELPSCVERSTSSRSESDYNGTVLQNLDAFLEGFPDADDWRALLRRHRSLHHDREAAGWLLSDAAAAIAARPRRRDAGTRLHAARRQALRRRELGKIVWHSKWQSFVRLAHTYRHRATCSWRATPRTCIRRRAGRA